MSHILATGQKIILTYDQRGQLTRAAFSGGRVITYTIDGEGRRLSRFVDGVFQTGYMHDTSGRLVAEVEPSSQLRSHFVYATESQSPDYMIRGGVRYYFARDQLGSIRAVINADTGVVAQTIHYDEFGRVLADTNPGFQPFGFAGGHFDYETGLVRFGARDYDAEAGRWLSKDPILFGGRQTNLYGYVNSDPVNYIDPKGTDSWLVFQGGHIAVAVSNGQGATLFHYYPTSGDLWDLLLGIFGNIPAMVREETHSSIGSIPGFEIPFTRRVQSPAQDAQQIDRIRGYAEAVNSGNINYSLFKNDGFNCMDFSAAGLANE